jgi:hypothetical protein
MTCLIKILWINQQDTSPIDGLAQIETTSEKVWFLRKKKDHYDLYTLDPEALKQIEMDHEVLCTKLGRPLYHGDPFIMNMSQNYKPEDKITIYNRTIEPKLVPSQYLMSIEKSQFSNYLVPHRIVF